MRDAALRPRLEGQQQSLFIEFTELLGLGTEAGPDGDHEMGMLGMHVLDELRTSGEVLREEVHGVPQVVGAPILPVLNDTVQGHLQFTILIDNAFCLGSGLIALLRLPEAVCPQREHRYIACQLTHQGNVAIGRAAIHKVIVYAFAGLRRERHAVLVVIELRGRVVLPIDAPALDALQHILEVL